ncbi:MAG: alanine racemase [Candidatus Omnitrophica bacterium]|nr:alanine racemase [Candidatus Omnitrophota bacterium]
MIRPLWIEVDLKALRNNLKAVRSFLGPKIKIIATIKQSAYGHGLIPVARELSSQGIDFFGVGSVEEAMRLRDDGFTGSILVLTSVLDDFADHFLDYDIIPTVVDLKFAKKLDKEAGRRKRKIRVHVKIDTGMGRLGFYHKEAKGFIRELSALDNLILEGIFTHFPVADSDPEFTKYQINTFNGFISYLEGKRITFKYQHCANSIGILKFPQAHFNMVRPGLILYGIEPQPDSGLKTQPLLSLKSKVIFVKNIAKGMSVSYGRTYIAKRASQIATVAIGYADGYPWALSNRSKVIIKNNYFNLAGRVCMDHIMVDIRNKRGICPGDEVILIGKSGFKAIRAEDLAVMAQTIPYEIVSRLSLSIPRIYKG